LLSLLMIDDEAPLCRSMTRLLRWHGIDVSAHTTPDAFMAEAATRKHDALLADLRLEGCEGTELFAELRERGDMRPFGVFSGEVTDKRGWELASAANADVFIPKSLEPAQLAAEILALCARAKAPARVLEIPCNVPLLGADGPDMCDIEALASLLRQQREPIADLMKRLRLEIAKQTSSAARRGTALTSSTPTLPGLNSLVGHSRSRAFQKVFRSSNAGQTQATSKSSPRSR